MVYFNIKVLKKLGRSFITTGMGLILLLINNTVSNKSYLKRELEENLG
jgi:hypothetical protein